MTNGQVSVWTPLTPLVSVAMKKSPLVAKSESPVLAR